MEAQNRFQKAGIDSAAVQKRVQGEFDRRDSIMAAMKQKRIDDSVAREKEKIRIQQYRDSITHSRIEQRKKDSIERESAKQKIIDERRKKDSIDIANKLRMKDSMERVAFKMDSIKKEEFRIRDSINIARVHVQDSIAKERKRISDSIKTVRLEENKRRDEWNKYVNSKHYRDSVEARKNFLKDSIQNVRIAQLEKFKEQRKQYNDSIKLAQQLYLDSVSSIRNRINDSTKLAIQQQNERLREERQRIKDSLLASREKRADSLNAIREAREKKIVEKNKVTNEKKKLALAIKMHETKQKEWSNEKLLNRKWSLHRRIYQNTVSRYNYYYNAKRKYNDALLRISKNNKEDFTKPISLVPYDLSKDGKTISADMDTVIKKCSFSTQIHDPRSKWFDDLFFLMGKASFAKNDYESAIATFQYVANEYKEKRKKSSTLTKNSKDEIINIATIDNRKGFRKLSHHPVRNQALIWLAKSYMMAEQNGNAYNLISILEKDPNFPDRNKSELFLAKANLEMLQSEDKEAIASLEKATKYKMSKHQKARTEFLLAQLYSKEGDYTKSSEHYKIAGKSQNTPEMDFYIRLNIAKNVSLGGGDKEYAKAELHKIINDPKYQKNKSEALNTLASIELEDNLGKAVELYKKSIKNPENKELYQKAVAFSSLGDIYYKLSEYELAKKSYDSASYFGSNPPISNLEHVNLRKNVLAEIVDYVNTIKLNDSLILLSHKSEKEKIAAAKKAIEINKKKEAEEAAPNQVKIVPLLPGGNVKSNWYFYNQSLVEKGVAEFKQKWGNRKLEDNWRRSSANVNYNISNEEENDEEAKKDSKISNDVQTLLAKIPKTPAEIDTLNKSTQKTFYNLGIVYFSALSDYPNSIKTFDTLLTRFPNTNYKQKTYYALYLNYEKLNQKNLAQIYKNKLIEEFGQSELSMLANNPNYLEQNNNKSKSILEHYDLTYQLYKEGKYSESLDRVLFAKSAYKNNPIQAKYALVEALDEAGLNNLIQSKKVLQDVISTYPNTDEQVRAQEILTMLQNNYNKKDSVNNQATFGNNENNEAKYANTDPGKDSLEASKAFAELRNNEGKGVFVLSNNEDHYVMIFVKIVDGRTMALKAGISDYNLLKNNLQEYAVNLNLFTAQQGVISIQKFSNANFAKKYMNDLIKENKLFSQLKNNEFEISTISATNYSELLQTRDILGYLKFYKKNYK